MSTLYYKCQSGEIKTLEEWQEEIDCFWNWAESTMYNIYRDRSRLKLLKRPVDYFERYAKLIDLKPVASYKGVF